MQDTETVVDVLASRHDMIEIEGGEVLANLEERTITGLVVPYNEIGRTNVGLFQVQAGVIGLPEDPSVVTLNLDHDRYRPVGRATRVWEEPRGIMATFAIANGAAGDAALADARDPNGKRKCLSGEFRTGIKAGYATGGEPLAASALVERGAFASAMVLAADVDLEAPAPEAASSSRYVTRYTDEDGAVWERVEESSTTTTVTQVEGEPAVDDTEIDPEEEETEMAAAVQAGAVPATQRKGAPAPAATTTERGVDPYEVMAAVYDVAAARRTGADASAAVDVLAALSDVVMTGASGLPTGGKVLRPNWLGPLYQGIPYVREFITLGTLGTNITAGGKAGYTLHRGTTGSPVNNFAGDWAGNKSEIKSGKAFTKSRESELYRFAFGADIGREFFDLPGGLEVVTAFFALVIEDHLVWSDEIARQTWIEVAGTPIAPKTYPGVPGHEYGDAMGMVVQGILGVKSKKADGRRDVPTFVIANEKAYEELIYTPKDQIPEFVKFNVSTDGEGSADGLTLVLGDTDIENTPSVIVGSGKAVEFDEIAGGPLRIDALDIARGGKDEAIHGYLQRFKVREEAVVHIGTPDA